MQDAAESGSVGSASQSPIRKATGVGATGGALKRPAPGGSLAVKPTAKKAQPPATAAEKPKPKAKKVISMRQRVARMK